MRTFVGYFYFATVSNTPGHQVVGYIHNEINLDKLFDSILPV